MFSYVGILVFIALALAICFVLLTVTFFRSKQNPSASKLSPYECGFDPLANPRQKFSVGFYRLAMLFIVFDLEIALLIPWAITWQDGGLKVFIPVMLFLAILVVGLIYEWCMGALEWE